MKMDCRKLLAAIAVVSLLSGGTAYAQRSTTRLAADQGSADQGSWSNGQLADDSGPAGVPPIPEDTAKSPPADASAASGSTGAGTGCGCGCGCPDECKFSCPDVTTAHIFDNNCWLKCEGVTITGWMDVGTASAFRPKVNDAFLGPDGFNDRDWETQVNEVYTEIKKAPKTDTCCWDWGYTVDLLYGTDYRYPLSKGLDARDDGTPKWNVDPRNFYGLAMPQAFVELANKAWDVKLGHFYTPLGNEVVPPTGNFFYSHSYTFLYAYPFTHTGAFATWTLNDQLSLIGGADMGWDNFDDTDHHPGTFFGATFTSSDKNTSLAFAGHLDDEPDGFGGFTTRYAQSIVFSRTITDRLNYVLESGDGWQQDGADGGRSTASWYGLVNYLTYKVNCCWTAGMRFEWFQDTNGTRVNPVGDFEGGNIDSYTAPTTGFAGNFYDLTLGANYKPNGNLTIRPEIRYDWYSGAPGPNGNGAPYDGGNKDSQWVAATDVIWQY